MADQLLVPDFPDGLPIGDRWVEASQSVEILPPVDGSLVASSPVGDVELAQRAVESPSRVRIAHDDPSGLLL